MSVAHLIGSESRYPVHSFEARLRQVGAQLKRQHLDTVQVNLGRLCNQSCTHCHVEAGPNRKEIMDQRMADSVIDFVEASRAKTVDLTGGAPELNPSFRYLVSTLKRMGLQIIVRSNLTVLLEENQQDSAAFMADQEVEIIASLPCYTEENVDGQRGHGVYQKSMAAMRKLNELGYGQDNSRLVLNLVYNPGGAFLPGSQETLEADYRQELMSRFGLVFNHLYTITNVDLGRFAHTLRKNGAAEQYAHLLSSAFNPATLANLMCLNMVNISWDGYLYDCDFNQMLNMPLGDRTLLRLGQQRPTEIARSLIGRRILTGPHCYACTAGSGSSCGGALL